MGGVHKAHPLFLIDASIYIFQSHFSANVQCISRKDQDLSALYGFIQFLLQFLRRAQPVLAATRMMKAYSADFVTLCAVITNLTRVTGR